jgi:hypothetical protein
VDSPEATGLLRGPRGLSRGPRTSPREARTSPGPGDFLRRRQRDFSRAHGTSPGSGTSPRGPGTMRTYIWGLLSQSQDSPELGFPEARGLLPSLNLSRGLGAHKTAGTLRGPGDYSQEPPGTSPEPQGTSLSCRDCLQRPPEGLRLPDFSSPRDFSRGPGDTARLPSFSQEVDFSGGDFSGRLPSQSCQGTSQEPQGDTRGPRDCSEATRDFSQRPTRDFSEPRGLQNEDFSRGPGTSPEALRTSQRLRASQRLPWTSEAAVRL